MTSSLAIRLSKGRGQSSCRRLQLSGRLQDKKKTLSIATEKISTFHPKKKKQKLECHVIKAVIESSVIFKNWWQRCKLIACIHSLHLISCFLFPTKSHIQETHRFFFPSFCEARFLNKMHKSKRRSVTAAWMNFPFSVLNATDLKYLPYYLNYCVKAGMSSDDDILSIQ